MKLKVFPHAFILLTLVSLLLVSGMITGCSSTSENGTGSETVTGMKVGVLPLVSALPLFVAGEEGYFTEEDLDIELVFFNSALEQDAALQAGEIDGYFNDPINAITMINGGVDISIINSPYIADPENRMFAIMVSAESKIEDVAGLKGVEIGIAYATNIEYMQEKILEHYGFTESEIASQEIKQIPIRLQLLLSGELEAALLPETLVSLAELQGARVIADDTVLEFSETIIALDNALMEQDNTLKERFLKACEKATDRINASPESCYDILYADCNIPEALQGSYEIPRFAVNHVPSADEIDEIQAWLIKKGVISGKMPYGDIVK